MLELIPKVSFFYNNNQYETFLNIKQFVNELYTVVLNVSMNYLNLTILYIVM